MDMSVSSYENKSVSIENCALLFLMLRQGSSAL
jgi:hypothetical protein